MDTYSITRELADSWGLLAMFLMFGGIALFAFRPGSGTVHSDIANIPFRNEDKPAPTSEGCCSNCDCCGKEA